MGRSVRRLVSVLAVAVLAVSTARAQTASNTEARYDVAYIDVQPAAVSRFVDAFHRYRDASRRDNGFGSFELFEQTGRPGHFIIVEQWNDQASRDAHAASASVKTFHDAFESIRTSGFDERPYKAMATAPAGSGRAAVWVVTHVDIGPGGGDAPAMLRREAETSRRDAGSIRFDVLQHVMRANHFTIVEGWATQQAYDAYAASAHAKRYRDELQPMSGSPLDERVFTLVE